MEKLFYILSLIFLPCYLWADDTSNASNLLDATTPCASQIFANQMAKTATTVDETADEEIIQQWIYSIFSDTNTLSNVLKCPEITSVTDTETIRFSPIQYTFPIGRTITVNYETQPIVLKQRLTLSNKRNLPTADPNPRVGDINDDAIWTNTNPAWYAIMVVESGTLDNFVGPDKNNTVSIQYINDNINQLFPHGVNCTTKHALARDTKALNRAVTQTVGAEDDSNDYYVAGDANLEWIGYTEIALDVVITVATSGGWTVISGATKGTRALRALNGMADVLKQLRKLDSVQDYIKATARANKLADEINALTDAAKIAEKTAELDKLKDSIKTMEKADDVKKYKETSETFADLNKYRHQLLDPSRKARTKLQLKEMAGTLKNLRQRTSVQNYIQTTAQITRLTDEINTLTDAAKIAEKTAELDKLKDSLKTLENTDDVKKYKETADAYKTLNASRHALTRMAKTGNVITRGVKAIKAGKAAFTGNELIVKGAKLGRASKISTRVKDWLFHSTMSNIGKLAKVGASTGFIYGALKFAGDMYDFTETSTGEFTNDIEFKPLLLLSADDITGQENVVNYGMWLMWQGDSTNPEDDDAAYLQAMDFAAKFHEDLTEIQNDTNSPCNVDIFVVRPIIRNPDSDNAQLYYLIMNDIPWTTN